MTNLELTPRDREETEKLSELLKKMETLEISYVDSVTDDIFRYQPFFLSVLLGHSLDNTPEEFESIMKIYFVVWEYYKEKPNIKKRQVTEAKYTNALKKNASMLNYANDEPTQKDKAKIYTKDLQNIKSKSLIATMYFMLDYNKPLLKWNTEKKGYLLLELKTFVECFDTI